MRIIYFTPLLSTVGGQERTLTDKANYLTAQGHQVMMVTYEHEGTLAYPLAVGVEHRDLACHMFELYRLPLWRRLPAALKLKRQLRQKLAGVLGAFRPDVIVVPIPNTENFICDVLKTAGSVPVVIESHLAQGHAVIRRGMTEILLYKCYNPMKAVRQANLLITLTHGDADCWRKLGVDRINVVPNPVTRRDEVLPTTARRPGRIIAVGRYTPQKRMDRLIDAFSLIAPANPVWTLDIFGEGEERENLEKRIAAQGMEGRIRLLPPTSDIYSEYLSSQFFVLGSDFEGFGLVVIEAMACGLPVVSTDCPFGPGEIISNGKTGLLTKLDVNDLAEKMEWMMTHDTERHQMGQQAFEASSRYSKERVVSLWLKAYQSVIS